MDYYLQPTHVLVTVVPVVLPHFASEHPPRLGRLLSCIGWATRHQQAPVSHLKTEVVKKSGSEDVPGRGGVVSSASCWDDDFTIALVFIGMSFPKSCLRVLEASLQTWRMPLEIAQLT